MQLREIAIERPRVAALQIHVVLAAEHDRAKPVPFGLVQVGAGRQLVSQLGQHGFDRRLYGQRRRVVHHIALQDGDNAALVLSSNHSSTALKVPVLEAANRRWLGGGHPTLLLNIFLVAVCVVASNSSSFSPPPRVSANALFLHAAILTDCFAFLQSTRRPHKYPGGTILLPPRISVISTPLRCIRIDCETFLYLNCWDKCNQTTDHCQLSRCSMFHAVYGQPLRHSYRSTCCGSSCPLHKKRSITFRGNSRYEDSSFIQHTDVVRRCQNIVLPPSAPILCR